MKRSLFFERRGRSISRVVVFVPRLASRPTYGQGSEREETEREGNRKLTVIAFNVTRARTDQSQLLEVTRSREDDDETNCFLPSGGTLRETLFAKTYGGMFRSNRGFETIP